MSLNSQFENIFGDDSDDDESIVTNNKKTIDLDSLIQKLIEIRENLKREWARG